MAIATADFLEFCDEAGEALWSGQGGGGCAGRDTGAARGCEYGARGAGGATHAVGGSEERRSSVAEVCSGIRRTCEGAGVAGLSGGDEGRLGGHGAEIAGCDDGGARKYSCVRRGAAAAGMDDLCGGRSEDGT